MKVIKVPEQNWSKRVNCGRCHAELELELGDIKANYSQRDGSWAEFTCGNCNNRCEMSLSSVPQNLHYRLKTGYSGV
jgi:transcription elongation factor Elf1